jgi:hypothetical protein
MKKTTPAFIATFLITAFLGMTMFSVGMEAVSAPKATPYPTGIVNIHTSNLQVTPSGFLPASTK